MRLKTFLDEHVKQIKKLVFVEINFSGQMQELVTNKCLLNDKRWIKKVSNIKKYALYPFFIEEIEG